MAVLLTASNLGKCCLCPLLLKEYFFISRIAYEFLVLKLYKNQLKMLSSREY